MIGLMTTSPIILLCFSNFAIRLFIKPIMIYEDEDQTPQLIRTDSNCIPAIRLRQLKSVIYIRKSSNMIERLTNLTVHKQQ